MNIKGTSHSRFELGWTGKASDLILDTDAHSLAHSGMGLDSMDLGDSLGYWEAFMRDPANDLPPITLEEFRTWIDLQNAIAESDLFTENGFSFKSILELPHGILIMELHQDLFEWKGNTDD